MYRAEKYREAFTDGPPIPEIWLVVRNDPVEGEQPVAVTNTPVAAKTLAEMLNTELLHTN